MAIAAHYQYRVTHTDAVYDTYTQAEAIEIARQLALEHQQEIHITDNEGKIRARVVPYGDTSYVDYYLTDRIAMSDAIVQGKPRIVGTRIPVNIILDYLAQGVSIEALTSEQYYPELTPEDILACIAYASTLIPSKPTLP